MPGEQRRAQILRTAMELFSENGFQGTTTKQIAECSGISEGMVFKHFRTKEELYSAILEEKAQEVGAFCSDDAIERRDDVQVLTEIALHMIRESERDPTFMRLLVFSALEDHRMSELFFRSRIVRKFDLLLEYIETRIREGAFKKIDPSIASRAFVGMIMYYITVPEIFGGKEPSETHEEAASAFVDIFLSGVKGED